MNSHPILFSTPMVEAILSGRKKHTRRVLKPQPQPSKLYKNAWNIEYKNHAAFNVSIEDLNTEFLGVLNHCPFGKIGDILWVRETFCLTQPKDPETYYFGYKCGADSHSYYPASEKYNYSTPDEWKPSIHMPKEACRIFLEITAIRVERLNEISDSDAIAEGIKENSFRPFGKNKPCYNLYTSQNAYTGITTKPIESFKTLWQSINGENSWEDNPWVWVIEFKRIGKPENFLS